MHQPLISIVLCSYNGAKFIDEQIQSLLQQTYPNLEIIISDDASTDGTPAILESYKDQPSFHIFFQQVNLGPVKNFDFAIRKATGAFIAFCDQDDIWLPQKVETLFAAIGEQMLVYCDSELVDEKGQPLHKKLSDLRHMYSGSDTRGFVFYNVVWGHTILINRQLVPHLLPIPDGIPHDIWMAVKAATLGGIRYLDVPLTHYRQHAQTVTKTIATDAQRRTGCKRYLDYKDKLHWIDLIRQQERPEAMPFYDNFYALYEKKKSGRFQWPLFFFMLKYRAALYRFARKEKVSQLNEIAKQARGVAP